jgi:Xaa-Pro aminopeptidase
MFEARFQTFEDAEGGVALAARLAALRAELARRGLTGFVVPRADQHQNEYVPPSEERLAWLTGFTGSAGLAVVLRETAALFVDGRYTLQAATQVDSHAWRVESLIDPPPDDWIAAHLAPGDRLGFDPWLHTSGAADKLQAACARAGAELIAVESNPIDTIWRERPAPPLSAVTIHSADLAGEEVAAKLDRIRADFTRSGVAAQVLSDPHAVAWTFNIRGADVAHTPLPLSYALVPHEGRPTLFIDGRKLSNSVRDHLERTAEIAAPEALAPRLAELARGGAVVGLDSATAAEALTRLVQQAGGEPRRAPDPVALL